MIIPTHVITTGLAGLAFLSGVLLVVGAINMPEGTGPYILMSLFSLLFGVFSVFAVWQVTFERTVLRFKLNFSAEKSTENADKQPNY